MMTLNDVLKDFAYLSVLILIGFELRKHIKLLQRYFIPTSLIAGTIGMFLSKDWLGAVTPVSIPFSSGIGQWSGVLVIVVCATMFLGLELNQVGRDGMATTFLAGVAHQGQMAVGLGIAALFGLFTAIPYQFGYMGVWASTPVTETPLRWEISSRTRASGMMPWVSELPSPPSASSAASSWA